MKLARVLPGRTVLLMIVNTCSDALCPASWVRNLRYIRCTRAPCESAQFLEIVQCRRPQYSNDRPGLWWCRGAGAEVLTGKGLQI